MTCPTAGNTAMLLLYSDWKDVTNSHYIKILSNLFSANMLKLRDSIAFILVLYLHAHSIGHTLADTQSIQPVPETVAHKTSDSDELFDDKSPVIIYSEDLVNHATVSEKQTNNKDTVSEKVDSFTNYTLHPSAVLFTASIYTTNNPLDNLKDFSNWNVSDVHDFDLNHENEITGNEFSYTDHLAVESHTHTHTTVVHHSAKQSNSEQDNNNVNISTAVPNSEEVTRVQINPSLFTSTVNYMDHTKEVETTTVSVTSSKATTIASEASLEQVTDAQVPPSIKQNPSLTHYRDVYHDIMGPLMYDAGTPLPASSDVTKPNLFTAGLLSLNEQQLKSNHTKIEAPADLSESNGDKEKKDKYSSNDHFDIINSRNQASLLSSETSTLKPTETYNPELYEVVTSKIDAGLLLEDEGFSVYEYENIKIEDVANITYPETEQLSLLPKQEDVNSKYDNFLENLRNKYKTPSNKLNATHRNEPKLFEESLPVLVENDFSVPKVSDEPLLSQNHVDAFQNSDASFEEFDAESYIIEKEEKGHPLISLMKIEPHAMRLLVKPKKFDPNTLVNNNLNVKLISSLVCIRYV